MEALYAVWLCETTKIPIPTAQRLLEAAGSFRAIYDMGEGELRQLGCVKAKEQQALCNKDLTRAEEILAQVQALQGFLVWLGSPQYPQRLQEIDQPPLVLYCKGNWADFDKRPPIAIVGQRKATIQGRVMAENLGFHLSKAGFNTISGLAAGIDGGAHRGAVKADGYTVGVLGTGLDVFYPAENSGLMRQMWKTGLVITEYPPQTAGLPANFPRRNRIVSALSRGVVVVEAQMRSGSLITARLAMEQGRDVFAVPGSVASASYAGNNKLIAEGAVPIRNPEDLIAYYTGAHPRPQQKIAPEPDEIDREIYERVKAGYTVQQLLEALDIAPSALSVKLMQLELKGYIVKTGHNRYQVL